MHFFFFYMPVLFGTVDNYLQPKVYVEKEDFPVCTWRHHLTVAEGRRRE